MAAIMWDALLWVYLVNATLLITHEIDSAYWHEWEMFRLPGGIGGFLVIHVPFVLCILYGIVPVARHTCTGLIFSAALSLAGLAAFTIHMTFIQRGAPQFKTCVSLCLLSGTLAASLAQAVLVIWKLAAIPVD